jgi:triacylglycerol esterase/lipase EstA (alpha/beta hydrolase family)
MNKQYEHACQTLTDDPVFSEAEEVYMIGVSQGGLIARAITQKCDSVNVKKLVSWGSPNGGVSALPMKSDKILWKILNNFVSLVVEFFLV